MAGNTIVTQALPLVIGALFIICGIVWAYVCFLGIKMQIKPNGAVGTRLNFSRYWRQFNQDKYWYDINRYGGKIGLFWALLLVLCGIVEIALPIDADLKALMSVILILFILAGTLISSWQIYRYAVKLVSGG